MAKLRGALKFPLSEHLLNVKWHLLYETMNAKFYLFRGASGFIVPFLLLLVYSTFRFLLFSYIRSTTIVDVSLFTVFFVSVLIKIFPCGSNITWTLNIDEIFRFISDIHPPLYTRVITNLKIPVDVLEQGTTTTYKGFLPFGAF